MPLNGSSAVPVGATDGDAVGCAVAFGGAFVVVVCIGDGAAPAFAPTDEPAGKALLGSAEAIETAAAGAPVGTAAIAIPCATADGDEGTAD